ncbi:MAG: hypothetical protein HYR97_08665 [Candidatus Melainabacteria bacterium]|nr:hypothetical protein [Candidatus Melainabacteria bacterium]MBI3309456.1 hypothetical protein [Candidatus Melainabacteria bacterium]
MRNILQIGIGLICVLATVTIVVLLVISELNFMDLRFGLYFGVLGVVASVAFFVLNRNDDNEETDPVKDKVR